MSEPTKEDPRAAESPGAAPGGARGNGAAEAGASSAGGGNGSAGRPAGTPRAAAAPEPPQRHIGEGGLNLKPSGRVHVAVPTEAGPRTAPEGTVVEDPVFSCRDVNVYYSGKQALKNVTIDV